VISLGFPYPLIDFENISESSSKGWISSYAIREDYHANLKVLAERLITKLQKIVGESYIFRAFTDSSPILEREFGVLGNLGWIGRNANLISPKIGSSFLLAEVLTDLETDPEEISTPDRCGKCQRCLDACPTKCIQSDRTIDARKCISFLTIENKKEIPVELRNNVGQWVFGCDICQTVCPWNQPKVKNTKFRQETVISPVVNLAKQLNFSKTEFENNYSGTPVLRAGWMGFTRNLIIAAGNLQDKDCQPSLIRFLEDHPSPLIRSHAAWALGKFDDANSTHHLRKALISEKDHQVISEIQSALTP
jgi:epoxyqueuosine reductase